MDPTLQRFIFAVRRWWWLAVLIPAVAAAAAYYLTRETVDKTYVARATVIVGDVTQPASNLEEERLRQSLATTYAALSEKDVVLKPVVDELSLAGTTGDLAKSITVAAQNDSQLIEVSVRRRQPTRAIEIANAVADQLASLSVEMATPEQQAAEARVLELQQEYADAQVQVEDLRSVRAGALALLRPASTALDEATSLDRIDAPENAVCRREIRDLESTWATPLRLGQRAGERRSRCGKVRAQRGTPLGEPPASCGLSSPFFSIAATTIHTGEDVRRLDSHRWRRATFSQPREGRLGVAPT
jgi:capsular polysaccharide biosynthesis protein